MRTKTFLMLLALSVLLVNPALAQGNLLSYGDNVVGTLSAGAPLGFYTFNGAAGDLVSIQVIGITPDLDPAISLNGPTQQQLASNDNDPASPGTTDARVTLSLPQDGIYTVLVSSVSGVNGDFLLRLSGQQPVPATGLSDAPLDVSIAPGQPPQIFSFEANPAAPITLTVSSSTPGFSFRVVVRDPSGQTIALLTASTLVGLNLPPGSGTYTAEIAPLDPNVAGQVSVSTGAAAVAPPPPAATQEAAPPPAEIDAASQVCQVGTGTTPVNVRSGPNTDYAVIGQIQPGQRLNVSGVSGTWFQVVLPDGRPGWVRRDVVVPFGPCDSVPQVDTAGIQPPGPAQTEEAGPGQLPTATFTPDPGQQAIQATPTYTYTPPAQQQQP
ncbi:MAG TPA: SH3 domain-containing protein, partial [Spirillospora sp.]|nr:SH3 domain-containing protein [Spirillospora sp.]